MNFVDKTKITIVAGDGGDGAIAFHREKYVAAGGPDGGDGGKGGSIIFTVDDNMSTLMDFKYRHKFEAENGMPGQGKRCNGKDGKSLYIKVPRGTVIRDLETNAVMHDMSTGEDWTAAKGGRGGWGNMHFATPTRQVPRFAKPGLHGETFDVVLELKLIADVGLVGYPNVGKSTFLSAVSKAHPKIANYHFTTLYPNLGVVYADEGRSFVMADIPGLIDGASEGVGLGYDFLRHVDRCRLLVHIVDISGSEGRDPVEDFDNINSELKKYNPDLAERTQIVVGNKADIIEYGSDNIEKLKSHVEELGYKYFSVSAATHSGIQNVINECVNQLSHIPAIEAFEPDYVPPEVNIGSADDVKISRVDDVWIVEGDWLERLCANINFSDYESMNYFDKSMREAGIYKRMESMGVADGDTVSIYNLTFEYRD